MRGTRCNPNVTVSSRQPTSGDNDQLFRILVQGVVDYAIYMLDSAGNISNWNVGGERIKGYTADEVVGRHFSMFYTEEDRARGLPARALTTATRDGRFADEGWRVRKDGTRFWASCIIDRILDDHGGLLGFAKVTRDLTEQKNSQEELERTRAVLAQSQKMEAIGQLTGGVAHDFNNLLTVITSSLDLLSAPTRDEAQRRRVIRSAQRAAERGAKLTQQLLAFSRRQPLRPEIHDIHALLGGFAAVLRRACPAPVGFEIDPSPLLLAANLDAPQFETALLNLVVNARDAMPHGGTLRIATGRERIDAKRAKTMGDIAAGDYVTVSVSDNGEGMEPVVLRRAFEPFFTTKGVGRGSGLGLSQVYGFVTQSGGHVAIHSTAGSGTTVTLYLPAAPAPTVKALTEGEAAPRPARGRVLVVEDDPDVLEVTVEILRTLGYEVLTAPDGPAAMSVLRRDAEIDILFSDVVMPGGMSGIGLARNALRLRPQLRVLLASGYPTPALTDAEPGAGLEFPFLSKPYRRAELAEALRSLRV